MRITPPSLALLAGLLLGAAGQCAAQSDSSREFYQSDFAAAPNAQAPGEAEREVAGSRRAAKAAPAQQGARVSGGVVAPAGGKKRRLLVAVYVNSLDKQHFRSVIEEVVRLHDQKLAFVTSVYHIGDYQAITPEVSSAMAKRGISIVQLGGPPPQLQTITSPTWEIRTKQGRHIAEGVIRIRESLNEWGEYVPRPASPEVSDAKLEGF